MIYSLSQRLSNNWLIWLSIWLSAKRLSIRLVIGIAIPSTPLTIHEYKIPFFHHWLFIATAVIQSSVRDSAVYFWNRTTYNIPEGISSSMRDLIILVLILKFLKNKVPQKNGNKLTILNMNVLYLFLCLNVFILIVILVFIPYL